MTPRLYDFRKYLRSRNISQNTFATRRLCEMRQTPNQNDQNTMNRATATIKRCPSDTEMIHLKSNGIQCYVTSLPGPARPPDRYWSTIFTMRRTRSFGVYFVSGEWGLHLKAIPRIASERNSFRMHDSSEYGNFCCFIFRKNLVINWNKLWMVYSDRISGGFMNFKSSGIEDNFHIIYIFTRFERTNGNARFLFPETEKFAS